jgi:hypothetical protein
VLQVFNVELAEISGTDIEEGQSGFVELCSHTAFGKMRRSSARRGVVDDLAARLLYRS